MNYPWLLWLLTIGEQRFTAKAAVGETIRQLLGSGAAASLPLSYLVEAVSQHDAGLLDDLQRLLDQKRRELRREKD